MHLQQHVASPCLPNGYIFLHTQIGTVPLKFIKHSVPCIQNIALFIRTWSTWRTSKHVRLLLFLVEGWWFGCALIGVKYA